ncbi:DUF2336 domain-containing protein [Bosea sp. SSUT16]|jgi:hypothetical protein|uniref:DUF2336 domain-containing protein n=1 Tax=Bosea spartocytisi TaxID=2773451 RepID=A0A927E5K6_9HYPH|nr:DUF2336 domain-containing protein [Bosea spartocytisi]MBD3844793.1 DUF2336 domain-containing protein [Bosea spartocytisi]MCT4470995.1 DUF2336 domain-containing protein [Bosea spartocytisi]
MLRDLTRMPAEMSSDSRRQLLNAVTDLFLLDQEPSEVSKEHYGDIAVTSLSHLGDEDRQGYADRVAALPSLPRNVAVTLGGDDNVEVARLVLTLSPVLTDTDLAAIAVSQTQQHLAAIAERARLSESVTDILVERGDRTVLSTVSANEGAAFSDRGFDRLLERGTGDAGIAGNLARRSDLAPKRAERVLRIVEQLSDGSGAAGTPTDEAVSLARQARQQRLEVKLLLSDLTAKVREVDDVLTMLADEDRAFHLAQVLSQVAEITPEQALRVLMQRNASGIAVTCRSLGVGMTAFRAILQLRARRLYFSSRDIDDDVDAYAKLDLATAERTLRFLKLRTKIA